MQKGPRFNSQYWKGRKRGREEWRQGGQAKDHKVKGQERRGNEAPPSWEDPGQARDSDW